MKILIFHPFRTHNTPDFSIISIGMITTANQLIHEGYDVTGINLPLQYALGQSTDIEFYLKAYKPNIVLISFHWYEFLKGTIDIAVAVKEYNPNIKVFVAGMSATFLKTYMEKLPTIDVVLQDGDDYVNIINLYCVRSRKININRNYSANEDFVNIKFLLNYKQYLKTDISGYKNYNIKNYWLCIARGCQYNCKYCGGSRTSHAKFYNRAEFCIRSWAQVKKDLNFLKQQHIDQVSFTHDLEMVPYRLKILEFFSKSKQRIYYESFQLPSYNFLEHIKQKTNKRCHIAITAISGNEKNRREEGKYFTNNQLVNILKSYCTDICFDVYFTLNVQGETLGEFKDTIDLSNKIKNLENLSIFCMPYFQGEIGSIRWIGSQQTVDTSVELLLDYLSDDSKTQYFLKTDGNNIKKMLLWNQMLK